MNGLDVNSQSTEDSADDDKAEPVELLVQLAEDGEIDPWDIDIVQVTEEFLAALDEGDLRKSGRALFYASVLLRMKSDTLLQDDDEEDERINQPRPGDQPFDEPRPTSDPIDTLEDEIERRLDRKNARGSPETLDELIRKLREAERGSRWKQSREYDTTESSGHRDGTMTVSYHEQDTTRAFDEPTATEVTERTHGEDIEEIIDQLYDTLQEHYNAGRSEVLFREIESAGGSRVQTYLAGLFLAHRGKIQLQQDELFGDLWLQDPTADISSSEAVAD